MNLIFKNINHKIETRKGFTRTPNLASQENPAVRSTMPKLVSGFTLVETLVAISILSLSILSGFTAVQNSLKNSITAKNQITAFYLVQDAMEYIKNIRDENALKFIGGGSNSWLLGLSDSSTAPCWHGGGGASKTCILDTTLPISDPNSIVNCTGTCPNIRRDSVTSRMGYNGAWTLVNFQRTVQLQEVVPDGEVKVTITISWIQGSNNKSFQISQSLYNRLQ